MYVIICTSDLLLLLQKKQKQKFFKKIAYTEIKKSELCRSLSFDNLRTCIDKYHKKFRY